MSVTIHPADMSYGQKANHCYQQYWKWKKREEKVLRIVSWKRSFRIWHVLGRHQKVNDYYSLYATPNSSSWDSNKKPEGELVELADTVIRIMDYCGAKGYDLENAIHLKKEFNKTRSYRHGEKKA